MALHRTIRFCERQIEYAPVAVRAYRMDPYNFNLPEHPGYETLISLYEEVGSGMKHSVWPERRKTRLGRGLGCPDS